MQISHIISSIDASFGGTSVCLALLCDALADYSSERVISLESSDPLSFDKRVEIEFLQRSFPVLPFAFSWAMSARLTTVEADVFHAHGIWLMPTHYAITAARKQNLPVVVSPHGMLEPGALKFSRWKKRLAGWLWQNRDLNRATCIHVTSQMEADNCRKYGLQNPIAIVPNGINLAEYPLKPNVKVIKDQNSGGRSQCVKRDELWEIKPSTNQRRTLLFLSRIHPKKGLIYLFEAWAQLKHYHDEWLLVIAGNDDGGHEAELKKLASHLEISWRDGCFLNPSAKETAEDSGENSLYSFQCIEPNGNGCEKNVSVIFAGPLFGDDKVKVYQEADLFVLPTLSENFGMVVPEALACGTPVITTKGAPWQELTGTKSGWWIDIGTEPLRKCLQEALAKSTNALNEMGLRGRKLVEDKYTIDSVAKHLLLVYEWCLSNENPPKCMRFD